MLLQKSSYYKVLFIIAGLFMLSLQSKAQQPSELHVVQVSGLVMNADSTITIPGVHIYDERGRGIPTDFRGWFSKAFVAGDTLTISAIGFKNRKVVVPDSVGDRVTVIFALEEEVTQLADIEVNPFPTEELFKEAILAMNLTREQENVLNSYEPEIIRELVRTMPLEGSSSMNYRYMMNQQFQNLQYSSGPRTNPLLNPFAWANFINSLKKKKN
ncbi:MULTISPECIES: hypothetical protein [Roseivirga]|jgi:hypothetical protein|uniref:Membrane receptor RagA n=1 Tax=Roseivirga thermotolerans TaxID=1758176 RepID=A0ABQ3I3R8_9BACT|nr:MULTISPECIES: hypothetical protein [Roseivirga]MEC7753078.1 hypothetical protein [Bacteroidota bacterium]GHE52096.1 hypothetical protein GCM10011340_02910 [Roseivirga thermotolerans]|tara:strand:- start:648 stop:1289 length:642 start_codon:yes stop_codon:yes gene_type:complete